MEDWSNIRTIEATIGMDNAVLRNLRITQTYHELNASLCTRLGGQNINWCGFATWASKTAGQFIRKDNLDNAIAEFLNAQDWIAEVRSALPGLLTWFGWKVRIRSSFLTDILNETAREAAQQVAHGNLLVFSELAPLFAEFLQIVSQPDNIRPKLINAFLLKIRTLDDAIQKERLIHAFAAYDSATHEVNSKKKAEKILLANLLVGFHEQIRLDPAINNSIHAPVDQIFRKKLLGSLDAWIEASLPGVIFSLLNSFIRSKVEPIIDQMSEKWREITTRELMKIEIPTGKLDLSEDIPLQVFEAHGMFSHDLTIVEDPELREVLRQLDRTPDTTAGSGAQDWGNLSDRMNFIADFFRSAQQDLRLLHAPFTYEQVEALRRGIVPHGKL